MKKLKLLLFLLLFPVLLFSEQNELFQTRGIGGSGASFLNTVYNAYGVSTGGILTIFGNTADTVFWNPAGLYQILDDQLQFSGSALSGDRFTGYVSFAKQIGEDSTKAIGFTFLNSSVGKIEAYDSNDEYLRKMDYLGNAFIFTYSKATEIVKIGVNFKILNEIMDRSYSWGGALDLGFIVPLPILPVSLGVNLKNLPGFIKWDTEKDIYNIAPGYSIGFGYGSLGGMKIGMDFSKDYGDEAVNVNLGGEFIISPFLSLRLGLFKGDFSGGVGVKAGFLSIDYAFYNERFLDISNPSQLISTTFHF